MNITEVRVKVIEKENTKTKALVSITIDGCFVVHDIKVTERADGLVVRMPNKKSSSGEFFDIVHPINQETRELVNKTIIEAYEKAKAEQPAVEA